MNQSPDNNHWKTSRPAACGTHHVNRSDGRALYAVRYDQVMPFHQPGLAPARVRGVAFHIQPNGKPAYAQRFARTFGFYEHLAAVANLTGCFHIHPNGDKAYSATWNWCGNFQQRRCPVRDAHGHYYHIRANGAVLPDGPYLYAGDFREGGAVVRRRDGLCQHITRHGERMHKQKFFDLDVFHKGFARARDADGWFHITTDGRDASYGRRYRHIEAFYNGQALVKMLDGTTAVIDEAGEIQCTVPNSEAEYRAELHTISVAFWPPLAIRLGVLLGLAGGVPKITCPPPHLNIVQRSWLCLGLLDREFRLTSLGNRLTPGNLERDRVLYWTGPQFTPWVEAETRIQNSTQKNFFAEHANHAETMHLIQQALHSYANTDWRGLEKILCLPEHATIVDVGGGQGALLAMLTEHRGTKILVDLPSALAHHSGNSHTGIQIAGLDFFTEPLPNGDVYLFSRVLHDWPDQQAMQILARIPGGAMVIVIDREDGGGEHGLLSLNMLLTTGSWERTAAQWNTLFTSAALQSVKRTAWNGHTVTWLRKKAC